MPQMVVVAADEDLQPAVGSTAYARLACNTNAERPIHAEVLPVGPVAIWGCLVKVSQVVVAGAYKDLQSAIGSTPHPRSARNADAERPIHAKVLPVGPVAIWECLIKVPLVASLPWTKISNRPSA